MNATSADLLDLITKSEPSRWRGGSASVERTTEGAHLRVLIQLRWLAIIGQIGAITLAQLVFHVALPLRWMLAVILGLVAINVIDLIRCRLQAHVTSKQLFAELLLDIAALTVQLYLTGGDTNPFISLFLLQVILGAALLEPRSSWAIVAITSGCYLVLTRSFQPVVFPHRMAGESFDLHVHGMFLCFLLASVLLVIFMGRINRNLRARDAALATLRQQSIEEDHIVRMGLLASGAAHELGTPLSTLSVLLNDWQHTPTLACNPELARDMTEMHEQLQRCKSIVSDILLSAGEARGEGTVRTTLKAFFDRAVAEWGASRCSRAIEYTYTSELAGDETMVSDTALKHVIFNLFDNALEASPEWLAITCGRRSDWLVLQVDDRGPGFSSEMLNAFGQPYRSTKCRVGRGIGLFLVINVVRKLGGTVTARNRLEGGARIELSLPLAALCPGEANGR